jgi:hypothetical protein
MVGTSRFFLVAFSRGISGVGGGLRGRVVLVTGVSHFTM